jgi:hypothetical protein
VHDHVEQLVLLEVVLSHLKARRALGGVEGGKAVGQLLSRVDMIIITCTAPAGVDDGALGRLVQAGQAICLYAMIVWCLTCRRIGSPNTHSWPCSQYTTGAGTPASSSATCTQQGTMLRTKEGAACARVVPTVAAQHSTVNGARCLPGKAGCLPSMQQC